MMITALAILLMMLLAYFFVMYGAVGFIQDKRFFGSAPKENLATIPDKKERFRGAHFIGWGIEAAAVLLFAGAAVLVVWDGSGTPSAFCSSSGGFLSCCIVWKFMIFYSSIGYCCATRTSFRIFIRS